MKAHIVLAHPETQSFNGNLAQISREALTADAGQMTFSDLYAMDFDPCEGVRHYRLRKDSSVFHTQSEQRFSADKHALPADVEAEIENLLACDLLVVHFPLWWFGPPAILKGWMDRVFVYGRMYRSVMRYDSGICAGKKMIACVTTGASADNCAYNGREGDTNLHLWPVLFPFRYLGFDVKIPEIFHGVGGVAFLEGSGDGLSTLEAYSNRWRETLESISTRASIPYNSDDEFDERKRLHANATEYSPFIRHAKDPLIG